jgi:hypothetical protein
MDIRTRSFHPNPAMFIKELISGGASPVRGTLAAIQHMYTKNQNIL